jgi:acetoin utilization protein AcuB
VTVRQWMTASVVSINEQASIQEALKLMKKHSIRHLPVVDEQQNLSGWVTDADLRGVLIASMLEDLTLEDVMVRNPYTAAPSMSLEEAARLILRKRIGGLPVVEEGKLVGVITVVDILSAFINIMGMLGHSSRLDVKASVDNPPLDEITRLIHRHHAEIISICHLIGTEEQTPMYSIRLKKCDLKPILAEFQVMGIEVVSAVA